MGTITFTDILPDPNNKIGTAGQADSGGSAGPGFASIQLTSNAPIIRDRTNSGRLLSRSAAYHKWEANITYNELTKAAMEPVYLFLLQKQGSLLPFYVELPQYLGQTTSNTTVSGNHTAGSPTLEIAGTGASPGDVFNISGDPLNSNHTKLYKVTRVETSTDYVGSSAPSGEILHITPPLQKNVSTASTVVFDNPKLRVIQTTDAQEYSLNNNNLYNISLRLEEAL